MKVIIVGNGGREHILLWKLKRDEPSIDCFMTIGNGGTEGLARSVPIAPTDVDGITDFAVREGVDLVVVGPEAPLELGLTDRLHRERIPVFGPSKAAARIETSKSFAKSLMKKYGIPTADFETFTSREEAAACIRDLARPLVVKASGLAAGKGAIVCDDTDQALEALDKIMVERSFGEAGDEVVIEERLEGEELSFFVLTDGETVLPLSPSQDHKRVYDGDEGPNTGGMGAYAPVSIATPELRDRVLREIIEPTIEAMNREGCPYRGVLYAGLMITGSGPQVIEFNARFGDPEAQVNLPLISSSLLEIMLRIASGDLQGTRMEFREEHAVCVVMASGGYPESYEKGKTVEIPAGIESDRVMVFHAGTKREDGRLVTSGGRVLGVTALGHGIEEARDRSYEAVERIRFEGCHFRRDIAYRELERISK